MTHIAFALLAGAGFACSALLGLFGIRVSAALRLVSIAVAAGVLLAIAFADLLPEAFSRTSTARAAFAFAVGLLLLLAIETATSAHTHHHDAEDRARYPVDDLSTYHALIPFSVGLGLHNLTDGLTIGASAELSRAAATGVTVGILIHQLPVGISFAAVLGSHRASRATVVRLALLLAVAIPIGATAVLAAGTLSSDHLGVLLGAAGGALTYVATGNLLPEVQSEQPGWLIALTFAATLLLAVCWFTVIAPG